VLGVATIWQNEIQWASMNFRLMEILNHPVLHKQAFTVLSSEYKLQHYSSCIFHVSYYFSH